MIGGERKHTHNGNLAEENYNDWWISSNGFRGFETETRSLSASDDVRKGRYGNFQVVWLRNIDRLIGAVPEQLDISSYSFVDVGCGSGISAIYTSHFFHFESYCGFDFRDDFIEQSKQNLEIYNKKYGREFHIDFFVANASDYRLPNSNAYFLFLYNPFNFSVAQSFFLNNMSVLSERKCIVGIANDLWVNELIDRFEHQKIVRDDENNLSLVFF